MRGQDLLGAGLHGSLLALFVAPTLAMDRDSVMKRDHIFIP
jgi:hypothetical protein